MHQLIWRKRTNTEPYLSTNDHGLYNYTNFKRRILHNSTHSDWEFLDKEESTFSSKFGGRPKLEEREVTPMHFSHLKIQHNWFSVKYCKEVHLLTPMLSIFDVDMHLEQKEDTSHLFWILICVFSQSKEGFCASPRLLFHGNRQKVKNNKSNNNFAAFKLYSLFHVNLLKTIRRIWCLTN